MNVVTFDLETVSVEEAFVRSDAVRLCGWAVNDGPVNISANVPDLVGVLSAPDVIVVGHNIVGYDLALLMKWHGLDAMKLVDEGRVRDTLVMARQFFPVGHPSSPGKENGQTYALDCIAWRLGVSGKLKAGEKSMLAVLEKEFGGYDAIPVTDPRYIEYLRRDVEVSRDVFRALGPADQYALADMRYLMRLSAISRWGVGVDADGVARMSRVVAQVRSEIIDELCTRFGLPVQPNAKNPLGTNAGKDWFTAQLKQRGVRFETDKDGRALAGKKVRPRYLEQCADPRFHEMMRLVAAAVSQWEPPAKNVQADGLFHPMVSAGQRTGRLSITKPGLTVFGKRQRNKVLSRSLVMPDNADEVLLTVDLSQIDARAVAAISQDPAYLRAFAPGEDFHTVMATTMLGDPSRRSDAKVLTHGISYGMGRAKLLEATGMHPDALDVALKRLDEAFPRLRELKQRLGDQNTSTGVVVTPMGRKIGFKPSKAWTQALASLGQGTARDLLMFGVLRLPLAISERIRVVVHDELVLSVPRADYERYRDEVLRCLQFNFSPWAGAVSVPIFAASGLPGEDWADCYRDEHPDWPEVSRAWRLAHPEDVERIAHTIGSGLLVEGELDEAA